MKSVVEALDAIEAAPLGNARLAALKEHNSPELVQLLTFAISPDITFGIKTLPNPASNCARPWSTDEGWFREMVALLSSLAERRLTGHKARDVVAEVLEHCSDAQRKWTERILKQDLRINIGAKDINKVLGADTIPLFQVPLATEYKKVPENKLVGHWYIQPKFDGARVVAVLPSNQGRVKLLSRTGKEWDNFESVRMVLQKMNYARSGPTLYLDGEVISVVDGRINFQALQKTWNRDDGVEIGLLQFMLFDAATEEEWRNPSWPYSQRYTFAQEVATNLDPEIVHVVPHHRTDVMTYALAEQYCNKFTLAGYEGSMLRRSDKPVQNKRSKLLLKTKTFHDAEALIVGQVEGTGKYVGMLGALVCKTEAGKQFEIGSGLDDAQRQSMWNNVVGQQVTFKYQELTDDQIPRFPVFKCLRNVKDIL